MNTIEQIVDLIIYDLTGRRGIKNAWDEIDEEIQSEIKKRWAEIIRSNLE